MVGASGFEPPTSWSRTRRASQAALRPEICWRDAWVVYAASALTATGAKRAGGKAKALRLGFLAQKAAAFNFSAARLRNLTLSAFPLRLKCRSEVSFSGSKRHFR